MSWINKISLSRVRLGLLPTINCQRREDTDNTQYNVDIVQCDYFSNNHIKLHVSITRLHGQ